MTIECFAVVTFVWIVAAMVGWLAWNLMADWIDRRAGVIVDRERRDVRRTLDWHREEYWKLRHALTDLDTAFKKQNGA